MSLLSSYIKPIQNDIARSYQSYLFLRLVSAILAGVVLVKIGYSKSDVSTFEWFLFITHAFSFFWSMGLKNGLSSYLNSIKATDQQRLLSSVFILFVIIGGIIGALLAFTYFHGESYAYLLGLYFFMSIPGSLGEHFLILKQKSHKLFLYGIVISALYLFLVTIGALLGDLNLIFLLLVVWSALKLAYTIFVLLSEAKLEFDFALLTKFLVFGSPLVLYMLFGAGMDVLDGFIVKHYFDDELFSVFRYGAKELPINTLIVGALVTATIPAMTIDFDQSLTSLKQRISGYMTWMFPLSYILILTSPFLFKYVYSETYTESANIFNIYLLLLTSRILVPQAILYAKKRNTILMWTSIAELVVNFLLSIYLMQYFGLKGIAIATVVAYVLEKVLLVAFVHRNYRIGLGDYIDVKKYILYNTGLYAIFAISIFYL